MFIYFSCYFDIDQGHSKQIEKEKKPRRKVIGLDILGLLAKMKCIAQVLVRLSEELPLQFQQKTSHTGRTREGLLVVSVCLAFACPAAVRRVLIFIVHKHEYN